MIVEAKGNRRQRLANRLPFFYGWIIVLASFIATFVGGGMQSFTFSIFMKPMTQELGWSRSAFTMALTMRTYAGAVMAPLFGAILDRHGPQLLMFFSAVVGVIAAILLSRVGALWQFYIMYSLVGLIGGFGAGRLVIAATIPKWFVRLRGRAVAFASMGNAASGAILAPFIAFVVVIVGWRMAWLAEGALFIVLIPMTLLMVRQPSDIGLLPDGAKSEEEVKAAESRRRGHSSAESFTLKEAMRTKAFWLLIVAHTIGSGPIGSVILHEYNFVTDEGFTPVLAAAVLSTHATAASAARLVWGFMVERIHVRYCIALTYLGSAVGLMILLFAIWAHSALLLILFGIVYGIHVGGNAVLGGVVTADYFGSESVGKIRGMMAPIQTILLGAGPLIVSLMYDSLGSYWIAFIGMVVMFIVGAVIISLATPPVKLTPSQASSG
ncbi:MAG: Sugar phosphate permease [Chloroflexi bacterium]|nr:MAG: Sugar phosphate permease [Chloroflexota bacterium]